MNAVCELLQPMGNLPLNQECEITEDLYFFSLWGLVILILAPELIELMHLIFADAKTT